MSISCILIDDEPNALRLLEGYIAATPGLSLKGSFYDAIDALAFLKQDSADLIFSDINMPLLSGLDLADILPAQQQFIFITAFAEHALASFNYHVIDYLLKPVSFKRFLQAIQKAERTFTPTEDMAVISMPPGEKTPLFFVKTGKKIARIQLQELLYVKGQKEYVCFQMKKEKILVYKRMKELEPLLAPYGFCRVHASYIINLQHIRQIEGNQVIMQAQTNTHTSIPIGDQFRNSFQQLLKGRIL